MPLPLQLKSWKGCIAELMAQSKFRVSLLRTMDFQGGNRGMGLTILMSLQSTARYTIWTLTELHRCWTLKHSSRFLWSLLLPSLTRSCDVASCDLAYIAKKFVVHQLCRAAYDTGCCIAWQTGARHAPATPDHSFRTRSACPLDKCVQLLHRLCVQLAPHSKTPCPN